MSTHTKGPWKVREFDDAQTLVLASAGKRAPLVATCTSMADQIAERHANARLIAAAPGLLSALELVCDEAKLVLSIEELSPCGDNLRAAARKARAVIRQAKGEE